MHLTKREPRQEDHSQVVDQLDMEEEHADQIVARSVHPGEMHERIEGSRKRTIQPSSALTDELCSTFRHVSFTLGSLDVGKMPF